MASLITHTFGPLPRDMCCKGVYCRSTYFHALSPNLVRAIDKLSYHHCGLRLAYHNIHSTVSEKDQVAILYFAT